VSGKDIKRVDGLVAKWQRAQSRERRVSVLRNILASRGRQGIASKGAIIFSVEEQC